MAAYPKNQYSHQRLGKPDFFLPKLRWGLNIIGGKMWVLSFVYTLFIPSKIKTTENQMISSRFVYPDPGSNRDGSESTGV